MGKPDDDLFAPEMTTEDKFNVFTSPYWLLAFLLLSIPFFVILTLIGNQIEVQATTPEQVYAFNALFAGIASDIVLRMWLKVSLVVIRKPKVPFVVIWVALCMLVFMFEPFKIIERIT